MSNPSDCDFEEWGEGHFRCSDCGRVIRARRAPRRNCTAKPQPTVVAAPTIQPHPTERQALVWLRSTDEGFVLPPGHKAGNWRQEFDGTTYELNRIAGQWHFSVTSPTSAPLGWQGDHGTGESIELSSTDGGEPAELWLNAVFPAVPV